MALIICPECKKKISDTAQQCPNCGYKLSSEKIAQIKEKNTSSSSVSQIIAGLFIIGVIYSCSGSKESTTPAIEEEIAPQAIEIASVALYKGGFPVCISESLLDRWTNGDMSSRIPMLNKYCYVVDFDREVSHVKSHGNNKVSFDYLDKGEFYGYEDGIKK